MAQDAALIGGVLTVNSAIQTAKEGKGYIEDRRPNANADPYVITTLMTNTVCEALA